MSQQVPLIPETDTNRVDLETNQKLPEPTITLTDGQRWAVFTIISLVSFFSNFDGGIVAQSTKQIGEDLNASQTLVGWFGSADYVGRIISSAFFIYLINNVNRKTILVFSLFFKAANLIVCFFCRQYWPILITRGLCGFSQVYYTIYFPVWCDQFGTVKSSSMMIAIIQIGCPLGILFGFVVNAIVGNWINSFMITAIILAGLGVGTLFIPNLYFSKTLVQVSKSEKTKTQQQPTTTDDTNQPKDNNTNNDNDDIKLQKQNVLVFINSEHANDIKSNVLKNLGVFFKHPMILVCIYGYSMTFYALGAIKFWGNEYMELVLGIEDSSLRTIFFGILTLTGPTLGLVFGGFIGGKIGGYHVKPTILVTLLFDFLACLFGLPSSFIPKGHEYMYLVVAWVFSFFSTSVMPLETGIILASVDINLKGDALSFTNFMLNLIGNLPPPFVYGFINQHWGDKNKHLAMNWVFYIRITSLVVVLLGAVYRYTSKKMNKEDNVITKEEEETNKSE